MAHRFVKAAPDLAHKTVQCIHPSLLATDGTTHRDKVCPIGLYSSLPRPNSCSCKEVSHGQPSVREIILALQLLRLVARDEKLFASGARCAKDLRIALRTCRGIPASELVVEATT